MLSLPVTRLQLLSAILKEQVVRNRLRDVKKNSDVHIR